MIRHVVLIFLIKDDNIIFDNNFDVLGVDMSRFTARYHLVFLYGIIEKSHDMY